MTQTKSKRKASHQIKLKVGKEGRKRPREDNENDIPDDIQTDDDNDLLIGDQVMVPDDQEEPLAPDEKDKVTPPLIC